MIVITVTCCLLLSVFLSLLHRCAFSVSPSFRTSKASSIMASTMVLTKSLDDIVADSKKQAMAAKQAAKPAPRTGVRASILCLARFLCCNIDSAVCRSRPRAAIRQKLLQMQQRR